MLLLGDIGNTDTKICLINDNLKIVKRVIISSKKFKRGELNSFLRDEITQRPTELKNQQVKKNKRFPENKDFEILPWISFSLSGYYTRMLSLEFERIIEDNHPVAKEVLEGKGLTPLEINQITELAV